MPWLKGTEIESFFTVKGILLFRLIFGFYFKLSNSIIIDLLIKSYCFLCMILMWLHIIFVPNPENPAARVYDTLLAIEITLHIFLSLSKNEFGLDLIHSFDSAILQTKPRCLISYSMIFPVVFLEIYVAAFIINWNETKFINITMFYYQFVACYASRLAAIFQSENYAHATKTLYVQMKENFESNMNSAGKCEHVQQFNDKITITVDFFDKHRNVTRFKVKHLCISIFFFYIKK
ncbi:hypothetical protein B5X24_HaOG200813 [Helicoverpa armigera]|nr:hypothetical protein B5X24_HaOG200813 [Helicoverpa armigera]